MDNTVHDFIGIGLGPFNLGLACLTEPLRRVKALFLDKMESFDWHPGMMLENATLQTPFLADLVTLADPTSRYSFLNYVKTSGRIYSFYIKENFFLMRSEYNQYCQWALRQLSNVRLGHYVDRVEYDEASRLYHVHCLDLRGGGRHRYLTRKLVLGTGTTPCIPECCQALGDQASHSASYLQDKAELQSGRSITIVGSGQSAAEIYYDLLRDIDSHHYTLHWFTRAPRFYPLEYSKLTLEMTSPDYIDYFHSLPPVTRDQLIHDQKSLYKGINSQLINAIFDLLYTKRLTGEVPTSLQTNAELRRCGFNRDTNEFELTFFQEEQRQHYRHRTASLVLATGYTYRLPAFMDPLEHRISRDSKQRLDVARNYSVDRNGGEIFVQNVGLYSHGLATPDLGMACYRNAYILREITGEEHYPLEKKIAFQQFAVPAQEPERELAPASGMVHL
ncbi:lysine N(6)-hydroxylase/L-ornithine N(5)-oxygenase family protein [Paludibacterium paludis]|uniref:Lysine N6-hydroxylase/L-ornithine N5-oxygenase family protein n=1 Tax=Paludibacterium paludis TaxID=1225769 RepID=A0A918UB19_9NEIS|nr:SidA/IucD/PvdA family monooxygenase [Paludibacterium paludis]GGY20173.1 lysine N6-hydroxylase/L-ornithine N5-oxygenase family protein [Paludibacterium paludis]